MPMNNRRGAASPTIPRGEILATFDTYEKAQQAVDVLARADFPVKQLAILGNDLKSVERVTGKLTWGRVALAGAASGAWLGVFLGLLLIIFSPTTEFSFLIAAVLLGLAAYSLAATWADRSHSGHPSGDARERSRRD